MAPDLKNAKFEGKIGLEFIVYYKDRRKRDRANITSVTEKYFSDALVELGCIPDDSDKYIEYSLHRTGGIDKENPRCEVTIIDLSVDSSFK